MSVPTHCLRSQLSCTPDNNPRRRCAVRFVNARPHPLALYLFSDDQGVRDAVMARTSSGGVCINDTIMHITNPRLPFGGVGTSGIGAYHGRHSFDCFSHRKSVLVRSSIAMTDLPQRYPPYDSTKVRAPPRSGLHMLTRTPRATGGRVPARAEEQPHRRLPPPLWQDGHRHRRPRLPPPLPRLGRGRTQGRKRSTRPHGKAVGIQRHEAAVLHQWTA